VADLHAICAADPALVAQIQRRFHGRLEEFMSVKGSVEAQIERGTIEIRGGFVLDICCMSGQGQGE